MSTGIYEPEAETKAGAQPSIFGGQAFTLGGFSFEAPAPAPAPDLPLFPVNLNGLNNDPVTQAEAKELFVRRKTASNEEFLRAYEQAEASYAYLLAYTDLLADAKADYAIAKADYLEALADAEQSFLDDMEEIEKDYARHVVSIS